MGVTTWRINAIDTEGGDLELSALELHTAVALADAGATISSSHAPISGALSDLADGNPSTRCRFAAADVRAPGFFIQWVLPSAQDVNAVRLGGGATAGMFPTRFSIQWLDVSGWVSVNNTGMPTWPGAGVVGPRQNFDPYWFKVTLLLRALGAAASTGISDMSPSPTGLSVFGATKVSIAQVKFGPKSIDFGTSGTNNYIQLTNPSVMAFQAQDFTFEKWCYFGTATPTAQQLIYHNYLEPFTTGSIFYGKHASRGGRVVFWPYNSSSTVPLLEDPTLPPTNEWVHYAVCRKGSTFTLRRNGVPVATATFAGALTGATVPNGFVSTGTASFIGFMEDMRVTMGIDRYANGESIPNAPAPPDPGFVANPLVTAGPPAIAFAKEYAVPSPTTVFVQGVQFLDTEFGGPGRVYGVVARKNTPANVPLIRRVRLHISRDGRMIRETWSNADGTYEFKSISMNYEYDTVAWDHEMLYRTVVANNLKPEAM